MRVNFYLFESYVSGTKYSVAIVTKIRIKFDERKIGYFGPMDLKYWVIVIDATESLSLMTYIADKFENKSKGKCK